MKAIEYINRYGDEVFSEMKNGEGRRLKMIFDELSNEIMEVARKRGVNTVKGLNAIIEEQNKKWNSFARLFNKKYGADLVRMNAIKITYDKATEIL